MKIISVITKLFSASKPKAVAFVDFEHWYISLNKYYHTRPDVAQWFNEVSKKYDLRDIYFFADFSNQNIRAEIPRIRQITTSIIETQNAAAHITKDFTDFIILDHIYQMALSRDDISTYIIFTGDGHFSSVVSFLKNRCHKNVELYGIRSHISRLLMETATRTTELPFEKEIVRENQEHIDMILDNLMYLESNNKGTKKMYPTFRGTVDAVSSYYKTDKGNVKEALEYLINNGYIIQRNEITEDGVEIKSLYPDWKLLKNENVYKPKEDKKTAETSKSQSGADTRKNKSR